MATEAEWRSAVLPFTLAREGGLSLDPKDAGNWSGGKVGLGRLVGTKYGIAAASHPTLTIRDLTLDDAATIYWRDYTLRPGFADLPLPLLLPVFDAGVNCGTARAKVFLATAPASLPVAARIRAVSTANLAFHRRRATWRLYGKGWSARIAACERQALLLAAAAPTAVAANLPPPRLEDRRAMPRAAGEVPAGLVPHLLCWLVDSFVTPSTQRT